MDYRKFSTGLSSGERASRGSKVMLAGYDEFPGRVPAGLIARQHGVRTGGTGLGDLFEVQPHRLGGAAGYDEAGPFTEGGANRPVLRPAQDEGWRRCAGPSAPKGGCYAWPSAGDRVLLADPGLVGKPDLYRLAACGLRDLRQAGGKAF